MFFFKKAFQKQIKTIKNRGENKMKEIKDNKQLYNTKVYSNEDKLLVAK